MEHLRVVHSSTINEEQYSTLIPESAIPVPAGISCCPLCNSNGPADSPVLLNHIAEHLHSFALRSLPWPGRESLHTNLDEQDDDDDPDDLDDGDHNAYNYFLYNDYFDQGSEVASRQYNLTSGSNRDSDGLPSLHSSRASERPATPSDKVSEAADDTSQTPDYDPMVEPGEPRPIIEASQDHLPEVIEGEWPQKCARRLPRDTDDPEVTRLGELMWNCMLMNYKRKAEEEGPDSQPINSPLFHSSPIQGFAAKVADLENQGNLMEAILWQTDAVNHFRDELGFAHYYVIKNVDKLAEMHWDAWNKEEADAFLSKEVEIFIENVGIRGFEDPVWTIDGAYDLATVCVKYRLVSLGNKLFNRLIDGFEQESKQHEDGTKHTEAARKKYSDFLTDQNLWKEIVVMERNSLARLNADPYSELDTIEALSRLAHALRQAHQIQEAEMIDTKIKAIRLFEQRREHQQIEALTMLEQIRRAEIEAWGPWNHASLPTLTYLFRFYRYMGLSDDAIGAAQELIICSQKIWGERGFASIGAVKVLTDYYSILFEWEKRAQARDLYNWLKAKDLDVDLAKETKPHLDLGPEDPDERAPRLYARPELVDTNLDHGNSTPSGPAKRAPTSERRGIAAGFSKALRLWRRDKPSDQ